MDMEIEKETHHSVSFETWFKDGTFTHPTETPMLSTVNLVRALRHIYTGHPVEYETTRLY